jgi:transcriptional regulator with XRE-family HTH domain
VDVRELAENDLRERLAANVRAFRAKAGMSAREAAERAEIPLRQWQRVEAGDVNATLKTLARIAYALRVDVPTLLAK